MPLYVFCGEQLLVSYLRPSKLDAAKTWNHPRRVIAKAEHTALGSNPRFILATLTGDPQCLYDRLYCARGEMENRIKECQLGLSGARLSGHRFAANQFRLLLASMAYILLERLRALGLAGTVLASAQAQTLRAKLLKVGVIIIRNTRRIRFFLGNSSVHRAAFLKAARHFASG